MSYKTTELVADVDSLKGAYGLVIGVCDRILAKMKLPQYDASFAKARRTIAEDTGLRPQRRVSAATRAKMSRAARKRWRQRWAAKAAGAITG